MTCSVMKGIAVWWNVTVEADETYVKGVSVVIKRVYRHFHIPFDTFPPFAVYFSIFVVLNYLIQACLRNGVVHSAYIRKRMWLLCRLVNREKCTCCLT